MGNNNLIYPVNWESIPRFQETCVLKVIGNINGKYVG
jgi:hypothetical protein